MVMIGGGGPRPKTYQHMKILGVDCSVEEIAAQYIKMLEDELGVKRNRNLKRFVWKAAHEAGLPAVPGVYIVFDTKTNEVYDRDGKPVECTWDEARLLASICNDRFGLGYEPVEGPNSIKDFDRIRTGWYESDLGTVEYLRGAPPPFHRRGWYFWTHDVNAKSGGPYPDSQSAVDELKKAAGVA